MKLVFNVPLGLDIGFSRPFKCAAEALAAGIAATGALASSGASAAAANANSHAGRVFSRWAVHQSQEEAARARAWQSNESQLARQWEEQMYNLYNSPSAMMRQYKEANINPYLVGSDIGSPMSSSAPMSGSGAQGSVVSAPASYMPDFSGIGRAGEAFMTALGVRANIASQEAQTKETLWRTALDIKYKEGTDSFLKFCKDNNMFASQQKGGSLIENYLLSQTMRETEQGLKTRLESSILETYGKDKAAKELNVLDQTVSLISQQVGTLKSQENLNYANGRKVASEIAKNLGSAARDYAVAGQLNALKQYLVQQACLSTGMSAMQFFDSFAEFKGNEQVRDFIMSDKGQTARKYAYVNTPEGNFALGFMQGLNQFLTPLDHVTPLLSPAMKPSNPTFNVQRNFYQP